jgi:hypothetical protein
MTTPEPDATDRAEAALARLGQVVDLHHDELSLEDRADLALARLGHPSLRWRYHQALGRLGVTVIKVAPVSANRGTFVRDTVVSFPNGRFLPSGDTVPEGLGHDDPELGGDE